MQHVNRLYFNATQFVGNTIVNLQKKKLNVIKYFLPELTYKKVFNRA